MIDEGNREEIRKELQLGRVESALSWLRLSAAKLGIYINLRESDIAAIIMRNGVEIITKHGLRLIFGDEFRVEKI